MTWGEITSCCNWKVFTFDNHVTYSHHSQDEVSIIQNRSQVRTSVITFTENNFPAWMMGALNSKIDEIDIVHKAPQLNLLQWHSLRLLRNFKPWSFPDSNLQPILGDAYFTLAVAWVHDTIIKHQNFSVGFRNIMKTAVIWLVFLVWAISIHCKNLSHPLTQKHPLPQSQSELGGP